MMQKKLSRRQARENAFLAAFSLTFHTGPEQAQDALDALEEGEELPLDDFGRGLLADLAAHAQELDAMIEAHLQGWTLARIPRASIVAIRLALAEMLYGSENKPGVAINEAVELVKKYGAENDYQFVNGLLGAVARERGAADAAAQPC